MLKYTICFIKRGKDILMLNRNAAPQMGVWNGVGGKLEAGETPEDGVIREIREETGIPLRKVEFKGIVTWNRGNGSGMYAFVAALPDDYDYATPRVTDEGILEWKALDWIIHPDNLGVAAHVKRFLPMMLNESGIYEYRCFFEADGRLVACHRVPLENVANPLPLGERS